MWVSCVNSEHFHIHFIFFFLATYPDVVVSMLRATVFPLCLCIHWGLYLPFSSQNGGKEKRIISVNSSSLPGFFSFYLNFQDQKSVTSLHSKIECNAVGITCQFTLLGLYCFAQFFEFLKNVFLHPLLFTLDLNIYKTSCITHL